MGDKLSEINLTSPTCLQEIHRGSDIIPGAVFWDNLKENKNSSKEANVVLSLDFGTKKIGVCIVQKPIRDKAPPLPVLKNDEHLFDNLDEVINEWLPNFCIIGKPKENERKL